MSINQFVATAVAEKLSAMNTATFFAERKNRADLDAFRHIMQREEPIRFRQLVLRAMAEGVISRGRAEELCPGIVLIDGKEEKMAKAKKIAALPPDERRNYSKRRRSAPRTSTKRTRS